MVDQPKHAVYVAKAGFEAAVPLLMARNGTKRKIWSAGDRNACFNDSQSRQICDCQSVGLTPRVALS